MLEYIKVIFFEDIMKLFAPKYYQNFKCIADKCKHSCCIGWEIDIDQSMLDKYASLSNPYSSTIIESIDFKGAPHFRLKNNNCPHLNYDGLCNIIINCGDEYICNICREHPRFYNFTNYGKEVGVGLSCEAACELILNSNDFDQIIEIDDVCGEIEMCEYDAIIDRHTLFKILKSDWDIESKVISIINEFGLYINDFDLTELVVNFEYLYPQNKDLFSSINKIHWNNSFSNELSRVLAYFIYRHCSESLDFEEFKINLSFSIVCTGLISTLSLSNSIIEVPRIVSEEIEYSEENTELIKALFY